MPTLKIALDLPDELLKPINPREIAYQFHDIDGRQVGAVLPHQEYYENWIKSQIDKRLSILANHMGLNGDSIDYKSLAHALLDKIPGFQISLPKGRTKSWDDIKLSAMWADVTTQLLKSNDTMSAKEVCDALSQSEPWCQELKKTRTKGYTLDQAGETLRKRYIDSKSSSLPKNLMPPDSPHWGALSNQRKIEVINIAATFYRNWLRDTRSFGK